MARKSESPPSAQTELELQQQAIELRRSRVEQCGRELQELLGRHGCQLRIRQEWLDGQPTQPVIFVDALQ